MQDVLGGHQDAVVAAGPDSRLGRVQLHRPEPASPPGASSQLERDRMAAARRAWPALWQKLDDAARRAVR